MDKIILWTIQDERAIAYLQAHEFLKGDLRSVEPDFRYAYRWLMKQLGYRNAPVWFWRQKPDLRESGWAQKGSLQYLLTVHITCERVTLTDFDLWHVILNRCYMSWDEADFDLHDYHWPEDKDLIEQSWNRLFAREKFDENWIGKEAYWQGTAERLYLHEVKSIRPFIAR